MKNFMPMLFTDMKGYNGSQFVKDVIAGIIVAIIALPLSIALAIASGVGPEAGIYTAIVAGLVAAFFGGSSVQITGPTAAFATIVAGIALDPTKGIEGLVLATIIAGIILITMGLLKFGNLIRFIPFTITTGFTAGIAVTLLIGQLKDFFGVQYTGSPIEAMEKLHMFAENIGTFNIHSIIIGIISLLILIIWPKIKYIEKIPASFIAVVAGSLLVAFWAKDVKTIGDSLNAALPQFRLPQNVSVNAIMAILPDAVTIALLAGIESLLSCVVADGMVGKKHRSNTELTGQGLANIASALFGGIPATGAIARTAANVKNGGRTPVSGMVHALVLLLVLAIFAPYARLIPMPVIAAILISVAYNMCQWRQFVYLVKTSPKSDIIILVTTFVLTVVFDLVVAIIAGIILACVLFMKRLSDESSVESWKYVKEVEQGEDTGLRFVQKHISVYELSGPLFFAVSSQIAKIKVKDYTKCIILRMRAVPSIDADVLKALKEFVEKCNETGRTVIFSHVNAQPMKAMKKSGLYAMCGNENFCANIDKAMERAESLA